MSNWRTRLIQVIETWDRRGLGTENDPVRMVRQLWTLDGELITEEQTAYDEPPTIKMKPLCQYWC